MKVYPYKVVQAGAQVNSSIVWESAGPRTLFGRDGVEGIANVDVSPELAVRLAKAWASTLRRGRTSRPHATPSSRSGPEACAHGGLQRGGRERDRPRGRHYPGHAAPHPPTRNKGGLTVRLSPTTPSRWSSASSTGAASTCRRASSAVSSGSTTVRNSACDGGRDRRHRLLTPSHRALHGRTWWRPSGCSEWPP